MSHSTIRARIESLIEAMSHQLYDKEEAIRLVLLAALAGESVFLLGPPGVAKSLIARRLKFAFSGAKAFEYLMGKFSTPDEVFGPVSIKKLKDEDKYERLTEHYLPGANIVFLDEIWKASPPIQNALLTVLNEKIFRNGEREEHVDLRALLAASNELPLEGEGLEALWDRFLLRLIVNNVSDEQGFASMLRLSGQKVNEDPIPSEWKIDSETFFIWQAQIEEITLPEHIIGLIRHLRGNILLRNQQADDLPPIYVSDRRWRKVVQLLRTSAFLHGREEVMIIDCFLIQYCIWDQVEQMEEATALVEDHIKRHGYRYLFDIAPIEAELNALRKEIEDATHQTLTREEPVAKRFKDDMGVEFVRVPKFWSETAGYLRVLDINKLKKDEESRIPLFEEAANGYRAFQTYGVKRVDKHQLLINERERMIETETVEREETVTRIPPEELKRVWESQIILLLEHCEMGIEALEARRQKDEGYIEDHLFIPNDLGTTVQTGLNSILDEVANLKLEIKKVRHLYESVEADRTGAE